MKKSRYTESQILSILTQDEVCVIVNQAESVSNCIF